MKLTFPFVFFFLLLFSTLDSRPKSSSPIRLPEVSGGQTNRSAEAEPQPSKTIHRGTLISSVICNYGLKKKTLNKKMPAGKNLLLLVFMI